MLLIPFFFACNDPTDLGLELEDKDKNVVVKDTTLTLPATTTFIDSLRTDQYTTTVFGQFTDDIYGTVRAISNNHYNAQSGPLPGGDSLTYHSASLVFRVSSSRLTGPTTGEQVLIYESPDTIFSSAIYLANRFLEKQPAPIADVTFDFNPETDSLITIPLGDPFGESLFALLKKAADDDDFQDSLQLNRVIYPPLVIEPGPGNQGLYHFNLADQATGIFVNMKSAVDSMYTYHFDMSQATRFTSVSRDRVGALLSDLNEDYDETDAVTTRVYLDMMHGVYPKIDLQPLIDLYESNEHFVFTDVQFSMDAGSTGSIYISPVSQFRFYFIRGDSTINATSTSIAGALRSDFINNAVLTESSYTGAAPALLNFTYSDQDLGYSGIVTLFSQILGDSYNEETDRYLTRYLVGLSPNGISMGQTNLLKNQIKVRVFYTVFNN